MAEIVEKPDLGLEVETSNAVITKVRAPRKSKTSQPQPSLGMNLSEPHETATAVLPLSVEKERNHVVKVLKKMVDLESKNP